MTRATDLNGVRPRRLAELAPGLLDELTQGLAAEGRPDLIPQLQELVVESRCGCQQPDCATIYVAGGTSPLTDEDKRERGPYWQDTVAIDEAAGHIAVDTDRYDRIVGIEIINRPDLRERFLSVQWRER